MNAKTTPQPKRTTHVLHQDDFTEYALSLGVWLGLTEDHGISADTTEIEITVTAVKGVH